MGMIEARCLAFGFAIVWLVSAVSAQAGEATYCVTCLAPARTYSCTVKTPKNDPGEKALRLYCMARSAAEGGHDSCAAARDDAAKCQGTHKVYTYKGPDIPPALRSAIEKRIEKQQARSGAAPDQAANEPPQKQDTLVDLTSRTLKSTREGAIGGAIKNTGKAVGGVAKGTGRVVGKAAKGTGRAVSGAARSTGQVVGGAIKSTGQAVGGAAKYTYNCVFSLFRNCSGDDGAQPEDGTDKDSEAPR